MGQPHNRAMSRLMVRKLIFILLGVCLMAALLPAAQAEGWMMFESMSAPTYRQVMANYTAPLYEGEALRFEFDREINAGESVTLDVLAPQDGLYEVHLDWQDTSATTLPIELSMLVDGAQPFAELTRLNLHSHWLDAGDVAIDRYGNEIAPQPQRQAGRLSTPLMDSAGLSADPLLIELESGSHSLTFTASEGSFILHALELRAKAEPPAYAGQAAAGDALLVVEGEQLAWRSRSSIRGAGEFNTALYPYDASRRLINFLDGASFHRAGDAIAYTFKVETAGWYRLGFHYRQNVKTNYPVQADLLLDGELPSQAARALPFAYSTGFRFMETQVEGQPQTFYLSEGSHTLGLRLNNQALTAAFELIDSLLRQINGLSLEIVRLTGGDTSDRYRDYNLQAYLPGLPELLNGWADQLEQTATQLSQAGEQDQAGLFSPMFISADQLRRLAEQPEDLPRRLAELSTGANSVARMLAQQLQTLSRNDLSIDRIYLYQEGATLPAQDSLLGGLTSAAARFTGSFGTQQYAASKAKSDRLQVWVGRPRQYVEILQNLVDSQFTPQTGIQVDLSLMPDANKLVLSNAAGTAPDAVLSLQYVVPSYLNIRGALKNLAEFPDFGEVAQRFPSGLFVPYTLGEGVYAMPETINFWVMFYRSDIFSALNIPVPNNLEDVKAILPELQRRNMNFFYPTAGMVGMKVFPGTLPLILQAGGAIYSDTVGKTTLDSEASLAGFREMTDLFTIYNLPIDVPAPGFYQQFRAGTLPIGIADLATYNLLLNAAVELEGQWEIAPFPGLVQEDGSVARWTTGGAETMGIMSQSTQQEEAWQFLKWWSDTAVQAQFGNLLQSTFGSEYIWPTANTEAFAQLPLASRHKRVILEQMNWMTEAPWVLGTYMLERELSNAYMSVVVDGMEARRALDTAVKRINRETFRKLEEFGYYKGGQVLKELKTPDISVVEGHIQRWQESQGEGNQP